MNMFTEHWEQVSAILQYQMYGISLSHVLVAIFFLIIGGFLFSGPQSRGFLGRVWDLILVFASIGLLLACVAGGVYVGESFDQTALGAFAGLMLFSGVFFIYSSFTTARQNAEARAKLAAFLKRKNKR